MCPVKQSAELDVPVALDARVGGAPDGVGGDIGSDHVAIEVVAQVEHVVLDAKGVGHPACVVHVGHCAAPRVGLPAPQAQGHPYHVMTCVAQQGGGH